MVGEDSLNQEGVGLHASFQMEEMPFCFVIKGSPGGGKGPFKSPFGFPCVCPEAVVPSTGLASSVALWYSFLPRETKVLGYVSLEFSPKTVCSAVRPLRYSWMASGPQDVSVSFSFK